MNLSVPLFAVIGNPIAQSRSPAIHAAFARQLGIELQYERVLAPLAGLASTVQQLRSQRQLAGCNITTPFKAEALRLASSVSPRAKLADAANTLGWSLDGRIWADNTDGAGLVSDIERGAGFPLTGRQLLLLGAGGASSGCLAPLLQARPARLAVWNRSTDKARALVERHAALATQLGVELLALPALEGRWELAINGTSAALGGGALRLPAGLLAPDGLAYDMVYGAAAEPFLNSAPLGAQRRDGLGMLVEQAAEAFALWHGQRPDGAPVLAALRDGSLPA